MSNALSSAAPKSVIRAGGWASAVSGSTYSPGIKSYALERANDGEGRERDDEFYYLAFRLRDDFIAPYKDRTVNWGFPVGGNVTLGEVNWLTKYSARKADGTKERYWEGLRRVIEGMYSIQKEHAARYRLPWDEERAHASAEEAYERAFVGKWSPPGRGFWKMGTFFVNGRGDSSALQNCAFLSTAYIGFGNPAFPFYRLMEMSMLGVGVGFDTKGAGQVVLHQPTGVIEGIVIDDSREGWYESTRMLLESFFVPGSPQVTFNYGEIRPAGQTISGFGGTSAGPQPLIQLHKRLRTLLGYREGETLTSSDIVDIMNMIGKCVVAANVRSSAEIALGEADDEAYINLKNPSLNPERMGFVRGLDGLPLEDENGQWVESPEGGWGYTSNNSVLAQVGTHFAGIGERIAENGEPGIVWLDTARQYGRLADPINNKDHRVMGVNPCGEQPLEHNELCVSGDTKIQTRNGLVAIEEAVGDRVEVWNGAAWSSVVPFSTGDNELWRVELSDGSYLDVTPGHEWSARQATARQFRKYATRDLRPGMVLPEFVLQGAEGKPFEWAYQWGWVAGDGFVDGMTDMVPLEEGVKLRDWSTGLPEAVFGWDSEAISDFMGGWIDTDGSLISNPNTDHYVLYGSEQKLRDAQLLLRRIGVNHASLREFAPKGAVTNKGIRSHGLWRLLIPSYEAAAINTKVKVAQRFGSRYGVNNAYPNSLIDRARKQKVLSVTKIADSVPTYCLNEHNRHMAVFGNVLTYQCTLVETYPTNCTDQDDYERTLKFAYLYGKTVTLLPTHWPETNEVMMRNRRIGTSMSGLAQFVEEKGWAELRRWMDTGYRIIKEWDVIYSEWLGIRESIKVTTIKPSGTVSLLFGVTPGAHWPTERGRYLRRLRLTANDPMAVALAEAGFDVEPNVQNPEHGVVVTCPTIGPDIPSEREISVYQKVLLAATCQEWWSDNSVSITASFDVEKEAAQIGPLLEAFDGKLKSISFLPLFDNSTPYAQMPYERIEEALWQKTWGLVGDLDWDRLYGGEARDAEGERYCTTDACEVVF